MLGLASASMSCVNLEVGFQKQVTLKNEVAQSLMVFFFWIQMCRGCYTDRR